ncbi:hypothetical protein HELRODRAFT_192174, partial [Helobdella robusta]|uniref:RNA-binding protein 48 n=1 Tax=Helobdella robusta TaxID=6412 RepID=T1FTN6_HELRO
MSSASGIRKRHHEKSEVCLTRPSYRNGRHPKAVKVYTVGHESIYLLVRRLSSVPGSYEGLINKMKTFGDVLDHKILTDYPKDASETFTDVALVKFKKLVSARIAKKRMDDLNYMGESLHCCYAPEFETVEECREKLETRRMAVLKKLNEEKLSCSDVVVSSDIRVGSDYLRNSRNDDIKGMDGSHGNHNVTDASSEQLTSNSFLHYPHISQQPQPQQHHQLYQQQLQQQLQFQQQIQQQFQQQIQHQQPHPQSQLSYFHPQFDPVPFLSSPYQHHQELHPQSFHQQ